MAKTCSASAPPRPLRPTTLPAWPTGSRASPAWPPRDPCPGFRTGQWLSVHAAALDFLANTAETAAALGWSTVALFGVHPVVGVRRVDCCGALMVSSGSSIIEVTPALIRYRN